MPSRQNRYAGLHPRSETIRLREIWCRIARARYPGQLFHGATEQGNKITWHLPILTVSRNNLARGQKVAVIGAGPAGLSCAHDLALMGYQVTVFEASGTPGGMMVHGIPEFRLERAVIERKSPRSPAWAWKSSYTSPLNENLGNVNFANWVRECVPQVAHSAAAAWRWKDRN